MTPHLPTITIVTPSFNQAAYLEATITSVLFQRYPNLEYIIVDGGSTDGSVEIIEQYADRLAYWCSEPDRGQSHAISKGFARSTGDILAWLASDDTYEPNTLNTVAEAFQEHPEGSVFYGDYYALHPDGHRDLKKKISFDWSICLYSYLMIPVSSAFWTRDAYMAVGGLRQDLHYAMDYELFLKLGQRFPNGFHHIRQPLSTFRLHDSSKSVSRKGAFSLETARVRSSYCDDSPAGLWVKGKLYLLKAELRFVRERRYLPLRKDTSSA